MCDIDNKSDAEYIATELEKLADQEIENNRLHTDGMFYRGNLFNYFTHISSELRTGEPSHVLIETLATIFENVAETLDREELKDKKEKSASKRLAQAKKAASKRLSQEFGLISTGNNPALKNKLIRLVQDGKKDKEISDYLYLADNGTSTIIENVLGSQKEPKDEEKQRHKSTPRHEINKLLKSEKLLDETFISILYFLNASVDSERCGVLTDNVTHYLISIHPYDTYAMFVGDKTIRDHVTMALRQLTKPGDNQLISIQPDQAYKTTEKGLSVLEQDILGEMPRRKEYPQKHTIQAINRARKKGLIKLEQDIYEITEKGKKALNPI